MEIATTDGFPRLLRVKAINGFGVSSSYTSASRLIVGATEPPNDVENFSVNMQGSNQMQLNWDAVSDLDLAFYQIRFSEKLQKAYIIIKKASENA